MTALLVACRGRWPASGLTLLHRDQAGQDGAGTWSSTLLAQVDDLSSLCWHPRLPIVYGTSGIEHYGQISGWRLEPGPVAAPLFSVSSGGAEPCHLAVHPSGELLVAVNYTTGSIASWRLDDQGSLTGEAHLLTLSGEGSGADPDRQDAPHPHQAVFDGDLLYVPDLGADLIRRFQVKLREPIHSALHELSSIQLPAGTGPRHLVVLADGRLVVDGELGQTVVFCSANPAGGQPPVVIPSTRHPWPSRTRHLRNHPGDLTVSPDGRTVLVANRGYDTVGVVSVGNEPALVAELDTGLKWPQHLSWLDDELLVAGWDSGQINSFAPGTLAASATPRLLAQCDSPGWVLPLTADRPLAELMETSFTIRPTPTAAPPA